MYVTVEYNHYIYGYLLKKYVVHKKMEVNGFLETLI